MNGSIMSLQFGASGVTSTRSLLLGCQAQRKCLSRRASPFGRCSAWAYLALASTAFVGRSKRFNLSNDTPASPVFRLGLAAFFFCPNVSVHIDRQQIGQIAICGSLLGRCDFNTVTFGHAHVNLGC